NEARAAGRLHHPNIVGVYEYGEDDKVAFVAMEYVDGTGLREYLNRKARFDFGQIIAITGQLLQAFEFAHARGVDPRDAEIGDRQRTPGSEDQVRGLDIGGSSVRPRQRNGTTRRCRLSNGTSRAMSARSRRW